MTFWHILKKTKQKPFNKQIYGFDVETYGQKNTFYCASLYGDDIQKTFYSKDEFIKEITRRKYRNSYLVATNLGFDFNAIFYDRDDYEEFKFLFRGSDMISVIGYYREGKFDCSYKKNKLTFIDTMNYCKMSVENLGKIIRLPKLEKPSFLGKRPKDENEKKILENYNMRDAEVSQKFIKFLFDAFYKLGADPKKTIASTAMSLFKNKYLKQDYFRHKVDVLQDIFKAYYGGRTEVFKRGVVKNMHYYDINSLYPSVMMNEYPDPNSIKFSHMNNTDKIMRYEGVSDVILKCPKIRFPLLPMKMKDGKCVFGYGQIEGWYSHVELRKAFEIGYECLAVKKSYYYDRKCQPFKEYVADLYNLRKEYKKDDNPMELVTKLLLNSLYGKFGQKFENREEMIPDKQVTIDMTEKYHCERVGKMFRIKKPFTDPSSFCIPIFAVYTTAYARLKLYDALLKYDPVYCDTDSIVTSCMMPDSKELGEFKHEMHIPDGYFIKPKFYAILDDNDQKKHVIKIKGLGRKIDIIEFFALLSKMPVKYNKFVKSKEAYRRNLIPNEIIEIEKQFSLEDDKRRWPGFLDIETLQDSQPIEIIDGMTETYHSKMMLKAKEKYEKENSKKLYDALKMTDFFDSKGDDITKEEFLKNETEWRYD